MFFLTNEDGGSAAPQYRRRRDEYQQQNEQLLNYTGFFLISCRTKKYTTVALQILRTFVTILINSCIMMLNKNNSTDVHIKDRMNSAIKSVNKELQTNPAKKQGMIQFVVSHNTNLKSVWVNITKRNNIYLKRKEQLQCQSRFKLKSWHKAPKRWNSLADIIWVLNIHEFLFSCWGFYSHMTLFQIVNGFISIVDRFTYTVNSFISILQ